MPGRKLQSIVDEHFGGHRGVVLTALACAAFAALAGVGSVIDARQLLGAPLWLKPARFFASFAVYLLTVAWLLGQVRKAKRLKRWIAGVAVAATVVEMVAISGQAMRGQRSHFNMATPFDINVSRAMGVAVLMLTVAMVVLLVRVLREKHLDPVTASGIRAGVALLLLGFAVTFPMMMPTAQQQAFEQRYGTSSPTTGSHTLGAPEGGPGLPFVNWSTVAGDPRAAHFLGIHGLQCLPLLALLVKRRLRATVSQKVSLVRAAALGWAGVTVLLLVQAMRHQPITEPDGWTVGGFVAIGAITLTLGRRALPGSRSHDEAAGEAHA